MLSFLLSTVLLVLSVIPLLVSGQPAFALDSSSIDLGNNNNHPDAIIFNTITMNAVWTFRIHSASYPNAVNMQVQYADQSVQRVIQPKSAPQFFYFKSVNKEKIFNVTLIDAVNPSKVYSQQGYFPQLPIDYSVSLVLEGNNFPIYRLNPLYPFYVLNYKCYSLVSGKTTSETFNSGNVTINAYQPDGTGIMRVDKPADRSDCLLYNVISLQRTFYEEIRYGDPTYPVAIFKQPNLDKLIVDGRSDSVVISNKAVFEFTGSRYYDPTIFRQGDIQYLCNITWQLENNFNLAQYVVPASINNNNIQCKFDDVVNKLNITTTTADLNLNLYVATATTNPQVVAPQSLFITFKIQYNADGPAPIAPSNNNPTPSSSNHIGVILGITIPIGVVLLAATLYYLRIRNTATREERKAFINADDQSQTSYHASI